MVFRTAWAAHRLSLCKEHHPVSKSDLNNEKAGKLASTVRARPHAACAPAEGMLLSCCCKVSGGPSVQRTARQPAIVGPEQANSCSGVRRLPTLEK